MITIISARLQEEIAIQIRETVKGMASASISHILSIKNNKF